VKAGEKDDLMGIQYLGHLPRRDALYDYLKYDIQPQLNNQRDVEYRVYKHNGSNDVYEYEETRSGSRVFGKFFLSGNEHDFNAAARRLDREFHHLHLMRGYGFDQSPHYVARPLGKNPSLNCVLVSEHCGGELLSSIIRRAIGNFDHNLLYGKLTALAYFFSRFHNRTANPYPVDFGETASYMDRLLAALQFGGVLSPAEAGEYYYLKDCWCRNPAMREDCQVLVHGDATPENFMHGDNLHVITFDLERLRRADRVFDIGRMAGEIAHFFMTQTGNRYHAEPLIGHFLWEYSCHFPDRERTFAAISKRVPFYMGITFLRIARNPWLPGDYRRRLVREAAECLRRFQS